MAVVGSYAINLNYVDVIVMFIAGLFGYLMKRNGFPVTPLILGLVLGTTIEDNFRKSMVFSDGSFSIFLKSPVSLVFLTLAVLMIAGPTLKTVWAARKLNKA
jgi:putative tricarboxylic transport membrane protein